MTPGEGYEGLLAVHCDMGLADRDDLARVHQWTQALLESQQPVPSPERVRDVLLVLDELASNALLHGTGRRRVVLAVQPDVALLEVADDNPEPAALRVDGMGLQLVDDLSARWGQRSTGSGKTVWARVAIS
jgi:two-component sensor histidine kinase